MSSGKFITNADTQLSEVINSKLSTSTNLYFLVWYFYFSWFQELYKWLWDKNIKVLVWMDVELWIQNSVREIFQLNADENAEIQYTNQNTQEKFIKDLKTLINKSDIFDSKVNQEALEMFVNKIMDWSLEIKKTLNPNHSKLYLFENAPEHDEWWEYPWSVITWSSNLTYQWLTWRYEFNCVFRDKDEYAAAKAIFDDLWSTAVPITEWWEDDPVIKMIKEETWMKVPSPYYCYMRLLFDRFENKKKIDTPADITWWDYQDLEYQVDAIKEWLKIIEQHNWVIIADVVWLWKSIIWSTLIHNLQKKSDKKAIIVCPPHLVDQWKDYSELFGLHTEIFSSWKINKALEFHNNYRKNIGYILIDEAHKYVNSNTIDYGCLHQMCQWKKVILLTATPFNNKPDDIFNLLKFFQIPEKSTINISWNLLHEFTRLQNEYKEIASLQKNKKISDEEVKDKSKKLAKKIRDLISCVVIRRSRLDLKRIKAYKKDLENQHYDFSKVRDPETKEYELWTIKDKYLDTLNKLIETDEENNWKNFRWARYNVLWYLKDTTKYQKKFEDAFWVNYQLITWRQSNMPAFIRRLLVSRFESSVYAFKSTLSSIKWSIDMIYKYLDKFWCVPVIRKWSLPDIDKFDDYDDYDEFEESQNLFADLEDFNDAKIENKKQVMDSFIKFIEGKDWFVIPKEDIKEDFFIALGKDKEFLEDLIDQWNDIDEDPKMESFVEELKTQLKEDPERKIVVFSQYADTVDALEKELKDHWLQMLTVTWKQKTQDLKKAIKYNFDAWIKDELQKDDFSILLWTDAISEWYNLHRAWTIYNYDIPYNPTRVIQRIWRINRINKKVFDELYIFNYFPSLIWENIIRWKEISVLKMRMINAILGNDTKVLTWDEELITFTGKENKTWDISDTYKEALKDDEENADEELSWETEYRDELKEEMAKDPDLKKKIYSIPDRSRLKRIVDKDKNWVLLFAKKWANIIFSFYDKKTDEISQLLLEDGFALFKASKDEEALKVSEDFYEYYSKIKEHIRAKNFAVARNSQEKKALDNLKMIRQQMENDSDILFLKDLEKAIHLWNLPTYYMTEIRSITAKNWKDVYKSLKIKISQEYLDAMIEASKEFDEQQADLIISEEF